MSEEAAPAGPSEVNGAAAEGSSAPEAGEELPPLARHAFRIGGLKLLVPQGIVCEVVAMPPIARVPNTARWLLGLSNLRGAVVPVFDLAHALGLASAARLEARLLVIDEGEAAAGVVIEALPTLERFAPAQRIGVPQGLPSVLSECATDCFARDDEQWVEFAHERLFGALGEQAAYK